MNKVNEILIKRRPDVDMEARMMSKNWDIWRGVVKENGINSV